MKIVKTLNKLINHLKVADIIELYSMFQMWDNIYSKCYKNQNFSDCENIYYIFRNFIRITLVNGDKSARHNRVKIKFDVPWNGRILFETGSLKLSHNEDSSNIDTVSVKLLTLLEDQNTSKSNLHFTMKKSRNLPYHILQLFEIYDDYLLHITFLSFHYTYTMSIVFNMTSLVIKEDLFLSKHKDWIIKQILPLCNISPLNIFYQENLNLNNTYGPSFDLEFVRPVVIDLQNTLPKKNVELDDLWIDDEDIDIQGLFENDDQLICNNRSEETSMEIEDNCFEHDDSSIHTEVLYSDDESVKTEILISESDEATLINSDVSSTMGNEEFDFDFDLVDFDFDMKMDIDF